jgi:hypothetical protein
MYGINGRYHNCEISRAYEYWRSKAGDAGIPARADIDPIEMWAWIPATLLVEAVFDDQGAPADFFFRVAGSRVCERYGRELTHRRLSEIPMQDQRDSVLANYRAAIETHRAFYSINRFLDTDGLLRSFEMLLLPLRADGSRCDMLLGVVMPLPRDHDAPEGVWIYEAGPEMA